MYNYKLILRYDGSRYKGWQRLGKDGGATIQAKLESLLSRLCNEEVELSGSGRTDAGVHALNQVANFHSSRKLEGEDILRYAREYLPYDIVVCAACRVDERFHSRYNAVGKRYEYRLDTSLQGDPFLYRYSWHVPEKLDYYRMRKAAAFLTGEHDFSSFTNRKSKTKSAIRTISALDITEGAGYQEKPMLISIEADGFLHNMVRIIVGTLVDVGKGTVEGVAGALAERKRPVAGPRAPAKGLFLVHVDYTEHR